MLHPDGSGRLAVGSHRPGIEVEIAVVLVEAGYLQPLDDDVLRVDRAAVVPPLRAGHAVDGDAAVHLDVAKAGAEIGAGFRCGVGAVQDREVAACIGHAADADRLGGGSGGGDKDLTVIGAGMNADCVASAKGRPGDGVHLGLGSHLQGPAAAGSRAVDWHSLVGRRRAGPGVGCYRHGRAEAFRRVSDARRRHRVTAGGVGLEDHLAPGAGQRPAGGAPVHAGLRRAPEHRLDHQRLPLEHGRLGGDVGELHLRGADDGEGGGGGSRRVGHGGGGDRVASRSLRGCPDGVPRSRLDAAPRDAPGDGKVRVPLYVRINRAYRPG